LKALPSSRSRRWRTMFSISTIASSTSTPTTSVSRAA
jgi:hypothetical protein